MTFHPVLKAFGGSLKIVGTGASTANQRMPYFADDQRRLRIPQTDLYSMVRVPKLRHGGFFFFSRPTVLLQLSDNGM